MCVFFKLTPGVEACGGEVGRSYYMRRVPEVSTFQRPGKRTHVEDIKFTSTASQKKPPLPKTTQNHFSVIA